MSKTDPTTPVDACPALCDRRTVLRSAGVLGAGMAGVAALAACGSDVSQAASGAASQAVGSATDAAKHAVKAAEIPVGGGIVLADARVVITQPKSGDFKAFSAVCTHAGCVVSDVSDGTINCGCHGSQFDIATGAVKSGPATAPLPPKTVKVGTDGITVS